MTKMIKNPRFRRLATFSLQPRRSPQGKQTVLGQFEVFDNPVAGSRIFFPSPRAKVLVLLGRMVWCGRQWVKLVTGLDNRDIICRSTLLPTLLSLSTHQTHLATSSNPGFLIRLRLPREKNHQTIYSGMPKVNTPHRLFTPPSPPTLTRRDTLSYTVE